MKNLFFSFVAVIVVFFASLSASAFEVTVKPVAGEVESLKDFRVSSPAGLLLSSNCKVKLLDFLGATVVEFDNTVMEADWGNNKNLPDAWKFSIDEEFVAPGTYTLVADEGAFLIGENQVPSAALSVVYTIPGEPVINDVALAQKMEGLYSANQHGKSSLNDYGENMAYERTFKMEVHAEGEYIYLTNLCDLGNDVRIGGIVNGATRKVSFSQQSFLWGWYRMIVKGSGEGSFTATISDDFQTLTFDDFGLYLGEDLVESVESLVLTRMPDAEIAWSVTGTTRWTTDEGTPSAYVADNSDINLTKYIQGEEVYYELTCFGGVYEDPTLVKFSVNEDGSLKFLNHTYGIYYDSVNKYDDSVIPLPVDDFGNPTSGIEGDAQGGKMFVAYQYLPEYWNENNYESGVITFKWGSYDVPTLVFTTDPADGSEVESFNRIVYTFPEDSFVYFGDTYRMTVVDEDGNVASDNVGYDYEDLPVNQFALKCNTVSKPGTYTITISKGSVYLNDNVIDQDIVIKLTIAKWDGSVVLPESVTTVDDLLNVPVTFPHAQSVDVSGFGVLGAVFDEDGDVYALLFTDGVNDFAGSVDVEGSTVNAHFVTMSDLKAAIGSAADSYAQRIGGFVEPEIGKATVYFCPKSFVVNGTVFADSISKAYTVAGSGQATGIDNIATDSEATYYDFSGRRIATPANGLVIKNGVKVIK